MTRFWGHPHFIYGLALALVALIIAIACAPHTNIYHWRETEDEYGSHEPKQEDSTLFGCTVRSLLNFSCDD